MKIPQINKIFAVLTFLIKVWFLTNLFSAIIITLLEHIMLHKNFDFSLEFSESFFYRETLLILYIGSFLSLPAMLILAFIIVFWTHNKLILMAISLLLVICSFLFWGSMGLKNSETNIPIPPIVYSLVILVVIYVNKLLKQ
ncbi:MAG: hypothetical protein JST62_03475 [Bacteroidetes bacterium]|jgi:hypothetical protein|nr:hypothetical protein [Bacteroidota bacterium]